MGLRRLEFLLLLFFFLLSSSSTMQFLFVSAFNEEQSEGNRRIWENQYSTKARLVEEITVDHRGAGGTGGSRGGTYSSNSAMNHGNNNDNKPSYHKSNSCTINHIGFVSHLSVLLLLSSVFLT